MFCCSDGPVCFGFRLDVLAGNGDDVSKREGEAMNACTVRTLERIGASVTSPPVTRRGWRRLQEEFDRDYDTVVRLVALVMRRQRIQVTVIRLGML